MKFRGAGQGVKALIAEVIAGELARSLGLPVPRTAFMMLDAAIGRNEPDYEIRTLLNTSVGLNYGIDYLPGSIAYDPAVNKIDSELASAIVWFDAFITNVDRTARNTNMLMWHKKLYLIDHGASLFFHHQWPLVGEKYKSPFAAIKDHVLLPFANDIEAMDERLKPQLTSHVIEDTLALVPEEWLSVETHFKTVEEHRDAYADYFRSRLNVSHVFVKEAIRARASAI